MRNIIFFAVAFLLVFSGINAFAKEDVSTEIPLTFSGYVHTATTYNLGDNEDENNKILLQIVQKCPHALNHYSSCLNHHLYIYR